MAKTSKNIKSEVKTRKVNNFIVLGKFKRIRTNDRKITFSGAEIKVSENNLRHIQNKHKKELSELGLSAIELVSFIVANFNQIRKGTNESYWLVVYGEDKPKAAAIELNYSIKKEFWEIKTAIPMRIDMVNKKTLLWQSSALSE
ncbi:MAG: hypothetical protein PHE56_13875 [Bacteroidales bacterium]|nr:hypothetical protein [Bacteroidales bacterium]